MSFTQADRPFRVKTPLGDDALLLESFEGDEAVSQPFRFVLRMLSEDPSLDLEGLLKKPVVISMQLPDESDRHIHGNISRITQLENAEDGLFAYEAEIVPWLWFLTLFSDCRIFQNKTAQEIVEGVFGDRGFSDFRFEVQGTLPTREYTVQFHFAPARGGRHFLFFRADGGQAHAGTGGFEILLRHLSEAGNRAIHRGIWRGVA